VKICLKDSQCFLVTQRLVKLFMPSIREADPGGLGACPQKKVFKMSQFNSKDIPKTPRSGPRGSGGWPPEKCH
jgi:hypothetical protein